MRAARWRPRPRPTRSGLSRRRWCSRPGFWWAGQAGEAKAILEAATRTVQAAAIPATTVYALGIRAAIALDDQDDLAAEALAREAIELMHRAELDEHPWAAMAHIAHGTLLGRRGELTAAAREIERGVAFVQRLQAWQLIAHASFALADVRRRQHQTAAARRLLTRVRDFLGSLPDPGDGFSRLERTEKPSGSGGTRSRHRGPALLGALTARTRRLAPAPQPPVAKGDRHRTLRLLQHHQDTYARDLPQARRHLAPRGHRPRARTRPALKRHASLPDRRLLL